MSAIPGVPTDMCPKKINKITVLDGKIAFQVVYKFPVGKTSTLCNPTLVTKLSDTVLISLTGALCILHIFSHLNNLLHHSTYPGNLRYKNGLSGLLR